MDYADRFTAGTEFTTGEGVSVGLMQPGGRVEWIGHIEGPLFHRAQLIAQAYQWHVLPNIEFYDSTTLVKAQCESLVEEIAFVVAVVNDDLLRDSLKILRDAALQSARSPTELSLVLAGP